MNQIEIIQEKINGLKGIDSGLDYFLETQKKRLKEHGEGVRGFGEVLNKLEIPDPFYWAAIPLDSSSYITALSVVLDIIGHPVRKGDPQGAQKRLLNTLLDSVAYRSDNGNTISSTVARSYHKHLAKIIIDFNQTYAKNH